MTRPTDDPSLLLSESEMSPLRALMDGLVVPAFLASPSYWEALKLARAGYSTRHLAAMVEGGGRLDEATRHARDRQAQRHERTRNEDWELAGPFLASGLHAALAVWAGLYGRNLSSPDFEFVLRMLGVAAGANRRVALLRGLTKAGVLHEPSHKLWRLARPLEEILGNAGNAWKLFFGLNLIVPALYQRFHQVDGAVLSLRSVRLTWEGRAELHKRLTTFIPTLLESVAVPMPRPSEWATGNHVVFATYHALWPDNAISGTEGPLSPGPRLLLFTAVAEGLRRMGPWLVARSLVRRRFVERAAETTGFSGQRLYEHVAQHYQIRSANTVRGFLVGPSLSARDGVRFNRGLVHELALTIRREVAESGPESVREDLLRERVQREHGSRALDQGLWHAAIRALEEEDLIRRTQGPSGAQMFRRVAQWELVGAHREKLEAGATLLLNRVQPMAVALAEDNPGTYADARLWVVPRAFLAELRRKLLEGFDRHASETGAAGLGLTTSERQLQGLSPCDVMLLARVMPLIP